MSLPTTKQIQRALIEANFLEAVDPVTLQPADDGDFGVNTQTAIKNYEAAHGLPMIGSQWTPAFLASLFPPPPKPPSIFDQIGTLLSVISILKGKTMTADQLTGIVRTLAVYLVTLAASHGWLPTGASSDVVAAIVAVGVAGWSIWSNRAKTIVPLASK